MKRQIRRGTFETNSSSTHAICITKSEYRHNSFSHIDFKIGEFGWENDEYDSLYNKASYLITAILSFDKDEADENLQKLKDILDSNNIGYTLPELKVDSWEYGGKTKYYYDIDGYIDHSGETKDFVNDVLSDSDKLFRYLFGKSVIITGNDLWLYLDRIKTFEAVEDMGFLIRELYDYANMMNQLSPKYDKYPRHFLTTHKIACRNYNRMKKEFPEELFRKRINKQYECSFGDYIFIYPKSTQDIKDESVQMSNCVSSYIDDVIDGKCHILFLRKKNKPDESLVTIEVRNNHIVQARRRFNDDVTAEDQKAIDAFNKKFVNKEDKAA